jgi:hypothetical protein
LQQTYIRFSNVFDVILPFNNNSTLHRGVVCVVCVGSGNTSVIDCELTTTVARLATLAAVQSSDLVMQPALLA